MLVERAQAAAAQAQDLVVVRRQLVGRRRALGGDAPLVEQLIALEDPRQGLGVADVDRQQHQTVESLASTGSTPFRISTVTSWVV